MRRMLNRVDLKIIKVYGDTITFKKFTKNSPRLVILATKYR